MLAWRTTAAASFVALALIAAGCGGGSSSSSPPAASRHSVEIADFKYGPETLEVPAGTKVTWTNDDDASHTATADDSSFDTGTIRKGDDASVVLDQPGTYTYYCRFHAFMKGTVEVE